MSIFILLTVVCINSTLQEKVTALLEAANYGQNDIVDILLMNEAKPDLQDNVGFSCFSAYKKPCLQ